MADEQKKGRSLLTVLLVIAVVALVVLGAMKLFGGGAAVPTGDDAGVKTAVEYPMPSLSYGPEANKPKPQAAPAPAPGNNGGWPE